MGLLVPQQEEVVRVDELQQELTLGVELQQEAVATVDLLLEQQLSIVWVVGRGILPKTGKLIPLADAIGIAV